MIMRLMESDQVSGDLRVSAWLAGEAPVHQVVHVVLCCPVAASIPANNTHQQSSVRLSHMHVQDIQCHICMGEVVTAVNSRMLCEGL